MRFSVVILSLAALAAAQETVWVTETVIGTDCAPTGYPTTLVPTTLVPTTLVPYPPSNATTTDSGPVPTYVPSPPGNATTTTGGTPENPVPTETLGPGSGAGSIFPASGFAFAGAIAAIMAIVA